MPSQINRASAHDHDESSGIRVSRSQARRHVTYFRARTRTIYLQSPTYTNENYGPDQSRGRSTLFVGLATGLSLDLAYSYTEALFDGGVYGGNRIPLAPVNKASAKLTYAPGDWRFSLASIYTGDRYAVSDQENAHEKLPGYTTFDFTAGYRFKRLAALFTVRNLTDKGYSEVGSTAPRGTYPLYPFGQQFFLRLEYHWGVSS
jgi:outer membrane receptor protein involved in Fe transport